MVSLGLSAGVDMILVSQREGIEEAQSHHFLDQAANEWWRCQDAPLYSVRPALQVRWPLNTLTQAHEFHESAIDRTRRSGRVKSCQLACAAHSEICIRASSPRIERSRHVLDTGEIRDPHLSRVGGVLFESTPGENQNRGLGSLVWPNSKFTKNWPNLFFFLPCALRLLRRKTTKWSTLTALSKKMARPGRRNCLFRRSVCWLEGALLPGLCGSISATTSSYRTKHVIAKRPSTNSTLTLVTVRRLSQHGTCPRRLAGFVQPPAAYFLGHRAKHATRTWFGFLHSSPCDSATNNVSSITQWRDGLVRNKHTYAREHCTFLAPHCVTKTVPKLLLPTHQQENIEIREKERWVRKNASSSCSCSDDSPHVKRAAKKKGGVLRSDTLFDREETFGRCWMWQSVPSCHRLDPGERGPRGFRTVTCRSKRMIPSV